MAYDGVTSGKPYEEVEIDGAGIQSALITKNQKEIKVKLTGQYWPPPCNWVIRITRDMK